MSAISPVSAVTAPSVTSAILRVGAMAQAGGAAPISPVAPVVPHKNPPAGLLAFDPSSPEVDLSGQPVEQMRALHQFRANLQYFQAASQSNRPTVSLQA